MGPVPVNTSWRDQRVSKYKLGARARKCKLGARAGEHKLGDRPGKYKLGARASKHKLGARAGGQVKGWELGNTNTLNSTLAIIKAFFVVTC